MEMTPLFILSIVLSAVAAYLIGSINFALVISKVFYHKDIRDYGSGNAGMTNMLRTFGKLPALFTLIGDLTKGMIAILVARLLFWLIGGVPQFVLGGYIAGLCAFLGHVFPIYYGFKGGKGILVTSGILIMIDPLTFGIIFLIFLIVFIGTKIISISSISASIAYPIVTCVTRIIQGYDITTIVLHTAFSLAIGGLVVYLHRGNIKRLLAGEEPKIGQKGKMK